MLGFLLTHELDAVKRHEWRVLPITSFLPEKTAEHVFIWAHVPLIAVLFVMGGAQPTSSAAFWISAFAVVHVFLHVLFRNHPKYEFNNPSSWGLILGAGFFGLAHLLITAIR